MSADISPAVELRGGSKTFRVPSGGPHTAVRGPEPTVGRGEFVAVGPTGCGMATTLTPVSGLEKPTEGEIPAAVRRSGASVTRSEPASSRTPSSPGARSRPS